jgi:hypothetical protein
VLDGLSVVAIACLITHPMPTSVSPT